MKVSAISVCHMKSVTLRTLLREPLKVKRMTRGGNAVEVTDKGEPLWVLQPASGTKVDEATRQDEIDELLDGVLGKKADRITLSQVILEGRR